MARKGNLGTTALLLILLLVIACFAGGWVASKYFARDFDIIDLKGGRQVLVLHDMNKVFPIYGKSAKAELDLALSQKQQILKTTAGGKYDTDVKKLYNDLDSISNDVRSALITSYYGLITKISATAEPSVIEHAFDQWDHIQELVIQEAFKLRAINQQLAAAGTLTSGEEWQKVFKIGDQALQGAAQIRQEANKQGQ